MQTITKYHRRIAVRITALVGSAALLIVGTAACSTQPDAKVASSDAACKAPAEVTVASFPVGVTLPTDVAKGIGAFDAVEKACHTTIKLASFDAPQPMVAGLLSGQIQFAVSNIENQLLAAAQGQNLTGLLSMAQGGNGIIVGNPRKSG